MPRIIELGFGASQYSWREIAYPSNRFHFTEPNEVNFFLKASSSTKVLVLLAACFCWEDLWLRGVASCMDQVADVIFEVKKRGSH